MEESGGALLSLFYVFSPPLSFSFDVTFIFFSLLLPLAFIFLGLAWPGLAPGFLLPVLLGFINYPIEADIPLLRGQRQRRRRRLRKKTFNFYSKSE